MMKKILYWTIPLLLILIFFLPLIASTPFGKSLLVNIFEKRLKGEVSIEKVRLSWLGPQRFENISFSNAQVKASISEIESNVFLWSLSDLQGSFQLSNGSFSFPKYGGGELNQVNAHIEASDINATGTTTLGGKLSIGGKIYSKDDFDITAHLKNMPAGAIDQVLQAKGLFVEAVGSTFDLDGTIVYNKGEGSLSIDFGSPYSKTNLSAALSEKGFTLKEPLALTLRLTKELSASLMKDVNPLFLTSAEAKNPIVLRVSTKNFFFPLPFSLEKLKIGQAHLDMGQVQAGVGKSLRSLLSFLKRTQTGNEINLWFTPVSLKAENGILETGRMDVLVADNIHICTWGNVNILRDSLDMVLGLPAETLAQSFGIQNLARNYVMKIPLRGSIREPELETGPAAAKIAAMAAGQQIPKGGGKIFGGLLNIITQTKDSDEDVPPPNRPFPWER